MNLSLSVRRAVLVAAFLSQECGGEMETENQPSSPGLSTHGFVQVRPNVAGADAIAPASDYRRTVVFFHARLTPWEHLFVRGGVGGGSGIHRRGDCATALGPQCRGIPIRHRNLLNPRTKAWKLGDSQLDWNGREPGQMEGPGGVPAKGTPMDWTTDAWSGMWGPERTVANDGYGLEPLNHYGSDYFMLDVDMDCARAYQAPDGTRWFELASFVAGGGGLEPRISQPDAPYAAGRHFGKCGMINVFQNGQGAAAYASFEAPTQEIELPPSFWFCPPGSACADAEASAIACPVEGVACAPGGRETTVTWTLNGKPFNRLFFIASSPDSPGVRLFVMPSTPNVSASVDLVTVQDASRIRIIEGQGAEIGRFDYAGVSPNWGGVTTLAFDGVTLQGKHGRASYYHDVSFDAGLSNDEILAMIEKIYVDEAWLTGGSTPPYHAFVLPAEVAAPLGADGDFAFSPDTATVNYGNPDWLNYIGGFRLYVSWKWAHELSHLFFAPIAPQFTESSCLNEGLADGVGNFLGYVPDSDFGSATPTLATTCRGVPPTHALGNCYLWHLKHFSATDEEIGPYWRSSTFAGLFSPRQALPLNTCATPAVGQTEPTDEDRRNGDAWVVYLSEATGEDMTPFVESVGLFSSGSLSASRRALGL